MQTFGENIRRNLPTILLSAMLAGIIAFIVFTFSTGAVAVVESLVNHQRSFDSHPYHHSRHNYAKSPGYRGQVNTDQAGSPADCHARWSPLATEEAIVTQTMAGTHIPNPAEEEQLLAQAMAGQATNCMGKSPPDHTFLNIPPTPSLYDV